MSFKHATENSAEKSMKFLTFLVILYIVFMVGYLKDFDTYLAPSKRAPWKKRLFLDSIKIPGSP